MGLKTTRVEKNDGSFLRYLIYVDIHWFHCGRIQGFVNSDLLDFHGACRTCLWVHELGTLVRDDAICLVLLWVVWSGLSLLHRVYVKCYHLNIIETS